MIHKHEAPVAENATAQDDDAFLRDPASVEFGGGAPVRYATGADALEAGFQHLAREVVAMCLAVRADAEGVTA